MGFFVGIKEGLDLVGKLVGPLVGLTEGFDGEIEGFFVGLLVTVGDIEGRLIGIIEGTDVELLRVGLMVGISDGVTVGAFKRKVGVILTGKVLAVSHADDIIIAPDAGVMNSISTGVLF